jgi:hypothetical protein
MLGPQADRLTYQLHQVGFGSHQFLEVEAHAIQLTSLSSFKLKPVNRVPPFWQVSLNPAKATQTTGDQGLTSEALAHSRQQFSFVWGAGLPAGQTYPDHGNHRSQEHGM